ncbi:MAG TPA: hypothetical protein VG537_06975 [Candidatus Kapabacteria bacterium]|jgi:hypothetical protein|nr:hypothetical protein [Candidatus Kapabacteria bacterium]
MKGIIGVSAVFFSIAVAGCSSSVRLDTPSGKPEITVPTADWERASVAITTYNLSKGRELDQATPNELVLYEAVPSHDGNEQVTSKIVYVFVPRNDSLTITSHRFITDDLDEENLDEAADQATLDAEQQELQQIAGTIHTSLVSSDAESGHSH